MNRRSFIKSSVALALVPSLPSLASTPIKHVWEVSVIQHTGPITQKTEWTYSENTEGQYWMDEAK